MIVTTSVQNPQHGLASPNYPFMDKASMTSTTGVFIPPSVFIDARLYPPNGSALQYISNILVKAGKITITISNDTGVTGTAVVSNLTDKYISVFDEYDRDIGLLVLDAQLLHAVAPINASHEFDRTAMPFVATTVLTQNWDGVNGLIDEKTHYLAGDVWLIGEDGIVLEVSDNVITVNAVGDPLFVRKLCLDEGATGIFNVRRPLKSLNVTGIASFNMEPDDYGNIQLVLGNSNENIIRLIPTSQGIKLAVVGGTT